jgi:hypothetical protein
MARGSRRSAPRLRLCGRSCICMTAAVSIRPGGRLSARPDRDGCHRASIRPGAAAAVGVDGASAAPVRNRGGRAAGAPRCRRAQRSARRAELAGRRGPGARQNRSGHAARGDGLPGHRRPPGSHCRVHYRTFGVLLVAVHRVIFQSTGLMEITGVWG